jgi:hypothetical protein
LLAGKAPEVAKTKAIGCSTKWAAKAELAAAYLAKLAKEPVTLTPADVDALKALRNNDSGKVRAVHCRVPRTGDDEPHVSWPRIRNGHRFDEPAR